MRGGVARGETARWRRREDAFHSGPWTRAGRFETRAKRTTTGAQSEDPSESYLGTPRRLRVASSLGRDDANVSAFRAERNFPFVRPAALSVPGRNVTVDDVIHAPSSRDITNEAPTPSRTTRAALRVRVASRPSPSRPPRAPYLRSFVATVVPPPSGPTASSTVSLAPARSPRARAPSRSVPRRPCARVTCGVGGKCQSERRARRGSRRTKGRRARARRGISNAPLVLVHARPDGRPSTLARVELAVSVVTRELKRRRCEKSGEEDGRCQRGGEWRCHGGGTRGEAGRSSSARARTVAHPRVVEGGAARRRVRLVSRHVRRHLVRSLPAGARPSLEVPNPAVHLEDTRRDELEKPAAGRADRPRREISREMAARDWSRAGESQLVERRGGRRRRPARHSTRRARIAPRLASWRPPPSTSARAAPELVSGRTAAPRPAPSPPSTVRAPSTRFHPTVTRVSTDRERATRRPPPAARPPERCSLTRHPRTMQARLRTAASAASPRARSPRATIARLARWADLWTPP